MPRWSLVVLLVVGVVCAGAGTALTLRIGAPGAAAFGWTAYSPLSSGRYMAPDLVRLAWEPRIGAALLAVGAGLTGAAVAALALSRRPVRGRDA